MSDTFGAYLGVLRNSAGYTQQTFADRINYSKALVGHIESARRAPTVQFAAACDSALGTTPLLVTLCGLVEGDDMRRRSLIAFATAAGITTAAGAGHHVAETIRHLLNTTADGAHDWDAIVADFTARAAADTSEAFGHALQANLMLATGHIDRDRDATRAAGQLALVYGMWLADTTTAAAAAGWYRTATALTERSGDTTAHAYTCARIAARGPYDNLPAAATRNGIDKATAAAAGTAAELEAHAAAVHLHALTGDLAAGRRAVDSMWRLADHLDEHAARRAACFDAYLHGRLADLTAAQAAYHRAAPLLRPVPQWHTDATMYYAHAHVRAGDTTTGVRIALDAITATTAPARVLRIGVADIINALPPGARGDDIDALAAHAAPGPHPWETMAA